MHLCLASHKIIIIIIASRDDDDDDDDFNDNIRVREMMSEDMMSACESRPSKSENSLAAYSQTLLTKVGRIADEMR